MLFWQRTVPGLLCGLFLLPAAHAISINATGDWESCQLQDTITDAGDYYSSEIQSDSSILSCSESYLTITGAATSTTAWTVTSRLESSLNGLTLDLKRTGNGTSGSTPSGGDSYVAQSTAAQTLFTGQGNVSQIPLQFRIRNFDVHDENGIKTLRIKYEITTN